MPLKPKLVRVRHAYEQVSTEIEMANMFCVNPSTVREGIRRLVSKGFVRRVSPRKMVVSIPGMAELSSRQTRALSLLNVTFDELWHVAIATEPLAAQHAGTVDLVALEGTQQARLHSRRFGAGCADRVRGEPTDRSGTGPVTNGARRSGTRMKEVR